MTVNLLITEEKLKQLTWEEFDAISDGKVSMARKVIARFMVDDDSKEIPYAAAFKQLGAMPITDIGDIMRKFMDATNATAVNPTKGKT